MGSNNCYRIILAVLSSRKNIIIEIRRRTSGGRFP